jgi:hypothetical protein
MTTKSSMRVKALFLALIYPNVGMPAML